MKKVLTMVVALAMILTMSNCKKKEDGNSGTSQDAPKVNVSCVVPINDGDKSDFTNLMTDGSIKWSTGTERIYVAIPHETNPQIIELTAFTTIGANILNFEALVPDGLLKNGQEYDVWYLGNSKNLDNPYYDTETKEDDVITSISGSIGTQSGNLSDLGYCHIAKTTVTAITQENGKVVLSMNGELMNQIAIAYMNLYGVSELVGNAIIGTEYTLRYNNGAFEFDITEDENAIINVTEGTAASYIVLLPNATTDVYLQNHNWKITLENGVQRSKIYYKHISDMEYEPLTWPIPYVDLGLPSGLKWATCNVGAFSEEGYGDYFAWGEISTKAEYTVNNSQTYNKQMDDISGNAEYDAATANWGGSWRMPTKEELEELKNECTWTWTTQNGVNGRKVTGPNGNHIFLPAAGYRSGSSLYNAGNFGFYWSSTPHDYYDDYDDYGAYYLNFSLGDDERVRSDHRDDGQTVRPITE